jgi:hypothetical protein
LVKIVWHKLLLILTSEISFTVWRRCSRITACAFSTWSLLMWKAVQFWDYLWWTFYLIWYIGTIRNIKCVLNNPLHEHASTAEKSQYKFLPISNRISCRHIAFQTLHVSTCKNCKKLRRQIHSSACTHWLIDVVWSSRCEVKALSYHFTMPLSEITCIGLLAPYITSSVSFRIDHIFALDLEWMHCDSEIYTMLRNVYLKWMHHFSLRVIQNVYAKTCKYITKCVWGWIYSSDVMVFVCRSLIFWIFVCNGIVSKGNKEQT